MAVIDAAGCGMVWTGRRMYVLFFDLWRASLVAMWCVCVTVGTAPTFAEIGRLVWDWLAKKRVPK